MLGVSAFTLSLCDLLNVLNHSLQILFHSLH